MTTPPGYVGAIPELYDRYMGPNLFEPYAKELGGRIPSGAKRLLEIAAGSGRLSKHLARNMDPDAALVVTDLQEPMLAVAKAGFADPRVTFKQADMAALPCEDGSFDAVFCQFGLMFVPDRPKALREMRRVLRPGGTLVLAVWDELGKNPASQRLNHLALGLMPLDPPTFIATPFTMSDAAALRMLVSDAGFSHIAVATVVKTGISESSMDLATGFVRGNPLHNQLVERGLDADAFERQVAIALAAEFGDSPCKSPLSAHVLTAVA